MRVIIVDDEPKAMKMLAIELKQAFDTIDIVGVYQNPMEAIAAINEKKPDILFLDIEMPIYSGFDVLLKCDYQAMQVIFVTAYSEYALQAIKANALDYILKPIDTEELITAVNKAQKQITENDFKQLQQFFNSPKLSTFIKIPSGDEILFFQPKDIIYCQASSNYTNIFTTHRKLLISKTLKYTESLLPQKKFIRVHQSYIVNTAHIKAYNKLDGGYLVLSNGDKVKIAKNKRHLIV